MIMVKRRYAAMTMSFILAASLFGGCTADNKSDSQTSESGKESQAVYGEVVSLSDDSIKIETGTLKEMSMQEKPDRENKDGEPINEEQTDGEQTSEEQTDKKPINENQSIGGKPNNDQSNNDQTEGEQPSMLDLTGEEQEILVTKDTVVKRQEMGRRPGGEDGNGQNKPQGEAPEAEEISLSDISEGDTVAITLDDDGNASQITVISMRGGKMDQHQEEKTSQF